MQFVINYEEGGENNILHGDAASEAFLSEIVGAAPWPGTAPHEHGIDLRIRLRAPASGGCWRMFTERGMPVTVYAVATAHGAQSRGRRADEGGRLGDRHPRLQVDRLSRLHAGGGAGRISPRRSASTPRSPASGRSASTRAARRSTRSRSAAEEGGFLYCADSYADDLPYWIEGPRGPQLIVPYTLDANDMRFATPQGFNSGDQFFAYLKDTFDTLYAEGETAPEDAVDRPALPAGRPARPRRRARPLPRLCRRRTIRSGSRRGSTSPATGSGITGQPI